LIDKSYVTMMAKYNAWQNRNLYTSARSLSDDERRKNRGAFFGSIHATFNHLLWADRAWLPRFLAQPHFTVTPQDGLVMYQDFEELTRERQKIDAEIEHWAESLDPDWLQGDLFWYSGMMKKDLSRPKQSVIPHFFNHQTHHRGQVHAMLTMAGAKPDDTDLILMQI
jgi:uncharacterized damage-inducible protein DinB